MRQTDLFDTPDDDDADAAVTPPPPDDLHTIEALIRDVAAHLDSSVSALLSLLRRELNLSFPSAIVDADTLTTPDSYWTPAEQASIQRTLLTWRYHPRVYASTVQSNRDAGLRLLASIRAHLRVPPDTGPKPLERAIRAVIPKGHRASLSRSSLDLLQRGVATPRVEDAAADLVSTLDQIDRLAAAVPPGMRAPLARYLEYLDPDPDPDV